VEEARHLYNESLEICKRLNDRHGTAVTLAQLGKLAASEGDTMEAARLFREALAIFERLGSPDAKRAQQSLAMVLDREDVST
jgi:Flp pilus assembly protein TadD